MGLGPGEPSNWNSNVGPFASHYDSGRVTRKLDARYEWAELACRSIEQYPEIEAASGLRFHSPSGFLFVRNDSVGIDQQKRVIERLGLPVATTTTDAVRDDFPDYDLPPGWTALLEPAPAGHIDPRMMVEAQLKVATQLGATVHRQHVTSLRPKVGGFTLELSGGGAIESARVLLATGAYLNDLSPEPLAARVVPEAVILAAVSPDEATRLGYLPSMIYLLDHPVHDDIYIVPPVRYPDGVHYVKMGGSIGGVQPLTTFDEKRSWMAGPGADGQLGWMREVLLEVMPHAAFERFVMKPCLITDTPHGLPYVDQVADGLFVAVGGNGHAAKSSDAIGALGASLALNGRWSDPDLDASSFRAVYGGYEAPRESRHGT